MKHREGEYVKAQTLDDFKFYAQTPYRNRSLHSQDRYVPSHNYDASQRFYTAGIDVPQRGDDMTSKLVTHTQMWIGIGVSLLSIVAIAVTASWTISNSINDKINSSRQELTTVINTSKSEVSARVDKLESKVDNGFATTNSGINDIKLILAGQKNTDNERSSKG